MCLRSCDVRSQMERKSSQSSQLAETTVVVSAAPSPPGKGHFLAQLGHAHLPEPPGAPSKLAVPDQRRTLCTQNAYIVTERTVSALRLPQRGQRPLTTVSGERTLTLSSYMGTFYVSGSRY